MSECSNELSSVGSQRCQPLSLTPRRRFGDAFPCYAMVAGITAIKTWTLMAGAKLDVQLTTRCSDVRGTTMLQCMVHELCTFLRKSNRPLRQASLIALDAIVAAYGEHLTDPDVTAIATELSVLVTDADLHGMRTGTDHIVSISSVHRCSLLGSSHSYLTVFSHVLPLKTQSRTLLLFSAKPSPCPRQRRWRQHLRS